MTAHKVTRQTPNPGGRLVSIMEVARGVREGRYEIRLIKKWTDGVYRLYLGVGDLPETYDISEVSPGVLMIKLGSGVKRVTKRRKEKWVTIPARYARGREGPVLVERVDERTLVVYLG